MKHSRRRFRTLPVLATLMIGAAVLTLGASAQETAAPETSATPSQDQAPAPAQDSSPEPATGPAAGKSAGEASKKGKPAPSKAEESATIEDDPVIAPDAKESADNNVTFPTDI